MFQRNPTPVDQRPPSSSQTQARLSAARVRSWLRSNLDAVAALVLLLAAAGYLWHDRDRLLPLLQDPIALRSYVAGLGWWGPLALVALNILQIVFAPIPGYGLFFAAGYLFDWFWGGVWGTVGLLLGALTAMWVARRIGRPFVVRMIGEQRLAHWEAVTHSDSAVIWFLLLLAPIGDAPYLLAGLARVSFVKILVLTIITRMPAAFAAAALGAGSFTLPWWQLLLIVLAFGLPLLLYRRYQEAFSTWIRRRAQEDSRGEP